jgi:hypothetical protein
MFKGFKMENNISKPVVIKNYELWNSGGNCMIDVFNLSNGRSIGITDECVCVYEGADAGMTTETMDDYGVIAIDLTIKAPELFHKEGSVVSHHTPTAISLNCGFRFEVETLFGDEEGKN